MSRKLIVADSLKWLQKQPDHSVPNFVSGICDMDETNMTMEQYLQFFAKIVELMMKKVDPNGYVILIQTDRKWNRQWISKSAMITNIALHNGLKQIWHKIVLHRGVDRTDLHRPTYAHMLCYSYNGSTGAAFPDVLSAGKKLYKNGTPINAAQAALEFIKKNTKSNLVVVDPFVGQGTIPVLANKIGLDAVGIDIDPKQIELARELK